ncbi:hypothetical protein O3P69_012055 [Scylla paramamosain]|uniref:Uncharacterized protein n=2 Tax=Scylla paramamosain TaxID=85552 RepID=A0AAW0SGC1_SCYPA
MKWSPPVTWSTLASKSSIRVHCVWVDLSGSSLVVKASDGKMVMVTLPNPLQENLEDVIEVQGVGQGQKVTCQSYVTFPQMQAGKFDKGYYLYADKT